MGRPEELEGFERHEGESGFVLWVHGEARERLRMSMKDPRKVLFAFGQWGWCRVDIHEDEHKHEHDRPEET
jgi:hypothetical protein